jgi:MoaA/NifB/PqqE/SkfB family radical SAM enzyme
MGCGFGDVNVVPLKEIWELERYRAFRQRVADFEFSGCLSCSGCDLREKNQEDCVGDVFPRCGECLWAMGLVQCP